MAFSGARICFALLVRLHIQVGLSGDWGLAWYTCYECTYIGQLSENCALVCMPKAGLDVWPDHVFIATPYLYPQQPPFSQYHIRSSVMCNCRSWSVKKVRSSHIGVALSRCSHGLCETCWHQDNWREECFVGSAVVKVAAWLHHFWHATAEKPAIDKLLF